MKRTYLVVSNGVVRDILKKELPLLSTDIDGPFDEVLIDTSGLYRIGDVFNLAEFAARNDVEFKLNINRYIDVERYKQ